MYTWDDHTADAPYDSPQWAASDRGWLYDDERTCYDGSAWCIGFYLTYHAVPGYRDAFVLACVYERYEDRLTGTCGTRQERSKRCASVQDARQWMLAEHTGQLALV